MKWQMHHASCEQISVSECGGGTVLAPACLLVESKVFCLND